MKHLFPVTRRPLPAESASAGQLMAFLMNVLNVLAPAMLAKEGVGQSGG